MQQLNLLTTPWLWLKPFIISSPHHLVRLLISILKPPALPRTGQHYKSSITATREPLRVVLYSPLFFCSDLQTPLAAAKLTLYKHIAEKFHREDWPGLGGVMVALWCWTTGTSASWARPKSWTQYVELLSGDRDQRMEPGVVSVRSWVEQAESSCF